MYVPKLLQHFYLPDFYVQRTCLQRLARDSRQLQETAVLRRALKRKGFTQVFTSDSVTFNIGISKANGGRVERRRSKGLMLTRTRLNSQYESRLYTVQGCSSKVLATLFAYNFTPSTKCQQVPY